MFISFVFLFVFGTSFVAVAEGQFESPEAQEEYFGPGRQMQPGWGIRPGWNQEDFEEAELVMVSGAVNLDNSWFPTIVSGGTEYGVMVPRYYLASADLKDGQQVTVEGYLFEGTCCAGSPVEAEDASVIHVTKATIDGTEYDLSDQYGYAGPGGMMGPGMMSNRGWGGTSRGRMPRGGGRR